jgi:hypothetical protein
VNILVNVLGWTGAVAVLLAYFLATTGRVQARSYTFQGINLYGAFGLSAVSLYYHVIPNVFLNVVWAVIGVAGIWSIWKARRPKPPTEPQVHCDRCGLTHIPNGIGLPCVPVDRW